MINKKIINSIYILLFLTFFIFHFYQLSTQHWSGVLDQDLIIIYNSILLNSGIEQEYRDHPAFTTFLLNSFFYKILLIFLNIPSQIDIIFDSKNINETFQYYFYISRTINFFFNVFLIYIFNRILKKLNLKRDFRFFICLIFILSIGYISSFFFLRSENLSLLFLCLSINASLNNRRGPTINFFIAGIFFAFAMLAKIQIIFLASYLIYLIPYFNKNVDYEINNTYLRKYLFLSFVLGLIFFFIFQLYIQEFPRFQNNKYLDLIFFTSSFLLIIIYFIYYKNFKKNIILFSSMINGFIFLIILIFLLGKINLLQVNDFIFLRITNPIHYMTEFTGEMANGIVNIDYILKTIYQTFSQYRFNLIELFIITSLVLYNLKIKNNLIILFFIFILNALIMNFRYYDVYHLYYMFIYLLLFVESIKKIENKLSKKLIYTVLIVIFINSLNSFIIKDNNILNATFNRENGMVKVCKEFIYKIPSDTYENVSYIKYYHKKFDDKNLRKICDEII